MKQSIDLVISIFELMPNEYNYFLLQLKEGIVLKIQENHPDFVNYTKFSLDRKLLNKYEDKKGRCFVIKGVMIFDLAKNKYVNIYFYIIYGILLGYSTPQVEKIIPDTQKIDISKYFVEFFANGEYEEILPFLNKKELSLLNPNDVYEVQLKDKIYYHLKDLEDGDFIGIDNDKRMKLFRLFK